MEVQCYIPRMSEAYAWEWQLLHKTYRRLHKVSSTKSGHVKCDQTQLRNQYVFPVSQ